MLDKVVQLERAPVTILVYLTDYTAFKLTRH